MSTSTSPILTPDEPWKALVAETEALPFLATVFRDATAAILSIYERGPVNAQEKECGSPLTEADLASAAIIERALESHFGIPVVCEESVSNSGPTSDLFWLVDPLDGTKEFLKRNGEFTVNIALVSGHVPVLGLIGIPVTGEIYIGTKGEGAYRIAGGNTERISNQRTGTNLIAAVSRSHGLGKADSYLEAVGVESTIACGSAIKFCRVAEGACDIYARFGRTMEWDTAAGQCILEESGCSVVDASTGLPLQYGKEGYANPSFIAARGNLDLPREQSAS